MSTPTPNENQPMREALQRDAASLPEPDFNPALHYATMRRVRGLAETPTRRFRLSPALATTAAVLALAASLMLWQMRSSSDHEAASNFQPGQLQPQPTMPLASLLTYQAAADKGDDALFALLDHDARELLPTSSPVFNAPLR
ncbi:MAG TPA: hypothetical protein VK961_24300 [Chthoniobacter sp.]|nr:hypothetical protein [Chthoniobacter sp.]